MESGFESGFMRDVGIIPKTCTKKAGVQMYIGMSESLNMNQALGGG
jgi:hypothetical protein